MAMRYYYGRPEKTVQYRNVIVVGKTGAGKSTVANKIIGCDAFKTCNSLESVTKRQTHAIVEMEHGDVTYRIKMVDTVGLFDTGKKITNEVIVENLKTYLTQKCPDGFNLVLFVFRKGRYTAEERETFDIIIKEFRKEVSEFSALVITHCAMGKKGRRKYLDSFVSDSSTRNISSFAKKGIYPVDFPPWDEDDDEGPSIRELRDVESLRQLIFSCPEKTLSREMVEEIVKTIRRKDITYTSTSTSSGCGIL